MTSRNHLATDRPPEQRLALPIARSLRSQVKTSLDFASMLVGEVPQQPTGDIESPTSPANAYPRSISRRLPTSAAREPLSRSSLAVQAPESESDSNSASAVDEAPHATELELDRDELQTASRMPVSTAVFAEALAVVSTAQTEEQGQAETESQQREDDMLTSGSDDERERGTSRPDQQPNALELQASAVTAEDQPAAHQVAGVLAESATHDSGLPTSSAPPPQRSPLEDAPAPSLAVDDRGNPRWDAAVESTAPRGSAPIDQVSQNLSQATVLPIHQATGLAAATVKQWSTHESVETAPNGRADATNLMYDQPDLQETGVSAELSARLRKLAAFSRRSEADHDHTHSRDSSEAWKSEVGTTAAVPADDLPHLEQNHLTAETTHQAGRVTRSVGMFDEPGSIHRNAPIPHHGLPAQYRIRLESPDLGSMLLRVRKYRGIRAELITSDVATHQRVAPLVEDAQRVIANQGVELAEFRLTHPALDMSSRQSNHQQHRREKRQPNSAQPTLQTNQVLQPTGPPSPNARRLNLLA